MLAMALFVIAATHAHAQTLAQNRYPVIGAPSSGSHAAGRGTRHQRLRNPDILRHLQRGCSLRRMKAGDCRRGAGGATPSTASPPDRNNGPVCINGRRSGHSCVCPAGGEPRRVSRNTYRCMTAPDRCNKGYVRVGRRCVKFEPPPPRPDALCAGGSRVGGQCICRAPARPVRIIGRGYRCVVEACPDGTRRVGRRCVKLPGSDPPTSEPPQRCKGGTIPRRGRCIPMIKLPCPAGSYRAGSVCVRTPTDDGSQTPPRKLPRDAASPPPMLPRPPGAAPTPPRPASAATTASANDDFEPGEVLVEIAGPAPQAIANRLVQQFRLVPLAQTQLTMLGVSLYRFRIPASSTVEETVAALTQQQGVASAQPNALYRLNDDARAAATGAPPTGTTNGLPQYALELIEARKAHAISRGGNVLVAIIDTGIDDKHPEIDGAIAAHYNAFAGQPHTPRTHGTAITGIITARRELQGIAPDARILAVQAFGAETTDGAGTGNSYRVASGLNWALLKGARIVNMSFAGRSADPLVSRLIDKGAQGGTIFIAAAGNGGPDAKPAFPASHEAVISVTAIDDDRQLYPHANVGAYVDLAAPGVEVMAPAAGNGYDLASGTSIAAAHVSGVAALMLAAEPTLKREALLERLKATAMDLGTPGPDPQFGAGCINAARALGDHGAVVGGPR